MNKHEQHLQALDKALIACLEDIAREERILCHAEAMKVLDRATCPAVDKDHESFLCGWRTAAIEIARAISSLGENKP